MPPLFACFQTLYRGKAGSISDLEHEIRHLDASAIREAVSRHVYDRDFSIAGAGRTEAVPNYPIIRYRLRISFGAPLTFTRRQL